MNERAEERHEDYRLLVEQAPFGMFRTDAAGRCVYTNAAWQAIYGLSLAQSLGDGWSAGIHPDDRETVFQQWREAAAAHRPYLGVFRVRRPDGDERWVRAQAWAVGGDAAVGFVGKVADITAEHELNRRLAGALELLDRTGRLSGVGGWEIDLATGSVNWSDQTCLIHDLPPGTQPTLEQGLAFYTPEARVQVQATIAEMLAGRDRCDFELPMRTARGRAIWVRVVGEVERRDGQAVRLFGATQDVTARRAADAELRRGREQLRLLYDETPALMASVAADGRVLSASRRLLDRLALAREAVVGAMAESLLVGGPDERAVAWSRVTSRLAQPGPLYVLPLRLRHADGTAVPTRMSATVERDAEGQVLRLLAVFDDISDDVRREAELARERALREEVERQAQALAQQADERRAMLDVLAHEVRQPLNNASAALQSAAALGALQSDPAALQRLRRAQSVIGGVVAQLDNTLAAAALLARGQPLERTDIDIDMLLQLVLADVPVSERARVVLQRDTPTRTASMDLALMRLALRNLVVNALRHAPADSPVTVRVSDSDAPLALLIDVEDHGPGVPEALRGQIFERGVRGPSSRGQGLGLHIARQALQLHGGTAELLRSQPGDTAFRLVLVQGEAETPYSINGALKT